MNRIFNTLFKTMFIISLFILFATFGTAKADEFPRSTKHDPDEEYVFHGLTPDLQSMADTLVRQAHLTNNDVKVYFWENDLWNGVTYDGNKNYYIVGVSYGVLRASKTIRDDYRFFLVCLAHELGHVVFSLDHDGIGPGARDAERQADYFGENLLYKNGYGCELVVEALDNMPEFSSSSDHPATKERREEARYACDSLEKTGHMPSDLYFEKNKLPIE